MIYLVLKDVEMQNEPVGFQLWLRQVRKVGEWIVLPAMASVFLADRLLSIYYPIGAVYSPENPRPLMIEWWVGWRNLSILLMLTCSIVSLPRWQSLVGIAGLVLVIMMFGGG